MSEAHFEFGEQGRVLTQCHESDKPTYSQLLGPDGKPLLYEKQPVGFQLTKKVSNV